MPSIQVSTEDTTSRKDSNNLRPFTPLKEAFDPNNINVTYNKLRKRGSVDISANSLLRG